MLNHVRTLLRNQDSNQDGPGSFGYEYVPANYAAVKLPSQLDIIRRIFFGATPDAAGLNYRLREFMPLLHMTEIVQYTLMDDPRFTYSLTDDRLFRETYTPQLVDVKTGLGVSFIIPPGADVTDSGQLQYSCSCVPATGGQWGDTGNPSNVFATPPVGDPALGTSGLSNPLQLPKSGGISMRLQGGTLLPNESFKISYIRKPKTPLNMLVPKLQQVLSEETALHLFGAGNPGRFEQFAAWWYESQQLHFQIAGILLALAHRTDLVRQGA